MSTHIFTKPETKTPTRYPWIQYDNEGNPPPVDESYFPENIVARFLRTHGMTDKEIQNIGINMSPT